MYVSNMQCARTKSNADGARRARPSVYKVHNTFYRYYIALPKSTSPKDKLLELCSPLIAWAWMQVRHTYCREMDL